MGRKAEARERRRERNKKIMRDVWYALGAILLLDLLVLFVALLSYDAKTVLYTFLIAMVILPLNIELAVRNMDGPSFWPFF